METYSNFMPNIIIDGDKLKALFFLKSESRKNLLSFLLLNIVLEVLGA